ncbi:MAG TPA: DNA-processing protein DprA [Candidatus Eisenbacteria bacterium]|nr:DNA-processing protein DprA [Candidatus Eisenbacteria bacterium]
MDASRDLYAKFGIIAIRLDDERYPPLLRETHDAPQVLFVRGNAAVLGHPLPLAVVGTRKISPYGAAAVRLIAGPAARAGAAIVSGLALGIDAAAHAAALEAGGATVAVLAGGVDPPSVGPRTNAALAERIVARGGALISERPPGSPPTKIAFPRRNRIIAGMSRGTLVIEAAAKSGSLITAYLALDAGRDVYAVPGPITSPGSAGTNGLIRRGAVPVTCADDLLVPYGLSCAVSAKARVSGAERAVLDALAGGPRTVDAVVAATSLGIRATLAALTALSVAGLVTDDAGTYSKN